MLARSGFYGLGLILFYQSKTVSGKSADLTELRSACEQHRFIEIASLSQGSVCKGTPMQVRGQCARTTKASTDQ